MVFDATNSKLVT